MSGEPNQKKRKEYTILEGHRRYGKTKYTCLPRDTHAVSYLEYGVPEIAWIAIMLKELGPHKSARVVELICNNLKSHQPSSRQNYLFASHIGSLPSTVRRNISNDLLKPGYLNSLKSALGPFINLYPDCPLTKIKMKQKEPTDSNYLHQFKPLLQELTDKRSFTSTIVLSLLIYGGMGSGAIKIAPGMFDNIEDVLRYPNTESSKNIAATLRAIATMIIGESQSRPESLQWCNYFWQRGFELEDIKYSELLWRSA
jgi:hypothetical protein